jgi:hypothetical protein
VNTQPLFEYPVNIEPGSFIGTEKAQIINTIRYYRDERGEDRLKIPSESEIKNLERSVINCAFPLLVPEHYITAEVRPNVTFEVNANFYERMRKLSQGYEHLKRGDLYKFDPGLGLFFLPEYIMKGIKDYDWKQHEEQIKAWMDDRSSFIGEKVREGVLYVPKPERLIVPAGKGSDRTN